MDYETKSSYTGQVSWVVHGDQFPSAKVTINVTDIEAGKPGTPTLTRTQFSEPTAPALDVAWTAAPANGTTITGYQAQYRNQATTTWTAYSGELSATTTSLNLPDLEPGATYQVQVRAVDSLEGEGPWSDAGSGQANRPPTAAGAGLADSTVAVDASTDNGIGDKFADADGDTLTFSASTAHAGVLTAALTGAGSDTLTVTAVNPASSTVTYGAHDGYGGYASRTLTVTGTAAEARSVAKNSPAGTPVGDPVTGTPYQGQALTYTLAGEAATSSAFVIDAATGQVSVAQGASLDYETKDSYTGRVEFTVQGRTATVNLTVSVTDIPPPPAPDAPGVTRSTVEPTTMLDVSWTATSSADSLSITDYDLQYRISGEEGWTNYGFTGTGTSTTLTGLTMDTTYEVRVRAHNVEGASKWSQPGEGATAPENNRPEFLRRAPVRTVPENSPAGTPVADGAHLDYETQDTYTLFVEASDGLDASGIDDGHIVDAEIRVFIKVTDVREPPSRLDAPTVTRPSNSATSTLDVAWKEPDMTGKPPLTSYAISYRKKGEIQSTERTLDGLQTSTTITGLEAGTTYEVIVRASKPQS